MSLPDLTIRPRRLRQSANIRRMVRETMLSPADFIYPMFVDETISEAIPVVSMPGVSRHRNLVRNQQHRGKVRNNLKNILRHRT